MKTLVGCLSVALLSSCEPPLVYSTQDRRQGASSSRIEGSLVVSTKARGRAIVLLYDAARPPPPTGTGRPVSFAVIDESTLFGSAVDEPAHGGPFTARYELSLIPAGRYLVRGFIDKSPSDFIPWYQVTADTNAGDVGGAAVDALTRAPRVVEIAADESGVLNAAEGVNVSFSDAATVPVDRPSFQVGAASMVFEPSQGARSYELTALPIDQPSVHNRAPVFLAQFVDADGDGQPDTGSDGSPLMWPKVIVRRLSSDSLLAEDTSRAPQVVVLAAGFDPTELMGLLIDPVTHRVRTQPVPVAKLKLVVKPTALDVQDPTHPVPLGAVPSGSYAVIVVQQTGQTWRVPNELAPELAPAAGFVAVEGQGFRLQVP